MSTHETTPPLPLPRIRGLEAHASGRRYYARVAVDPRDAATLARLAEEEGSTPAVIIRRWAKAALRAEEYGREQLGQAADRLSRAGRS